MTSQQIQTYRELSPAKINLLLRIGKKRKDGFHELESLMAKLAWGDDIRLQIRQSTSTKVHIQCSEKSLEKPSNLAVKAAELFSERLLVFFEARISIKKRIPMEAGLAGGSGNAASILKMLSQWYSQTIGELKNSKLEQMAEELGSDVPFFLTEKNAAWCTGRGELCKACWLPEWNFVLVFPKDRISTAWAYQQKPGRGLKGPPKWLKQASSLPVDFVPDLENDFSPVATEYYPTLSRLYYQDLCLSGASAGEMTGSGSCFYGLYPNEKKALLGLSFLKERGWQAVLAKLSTKPE